VQTLFLHVGIVPWPASARQHCADQGNAPSWPAVIVLRDLSRRSPLVFCDGPDWKIASGLLGSGFCVRRFRAAVVTGGSAARIPVG
jgi:hypothetical protein